jgi:hypothetical protein
MAVKLVLRAQTFPFNEMMRSCKYFPCVSKMPTLTYNKANRILIKNAIILNIIHKIFNIRDKDVVICILSGAIVVVIVW